MFVLIHAPLVGPLTWTLVAAELRRRGITVCAPALAQTPETGERYWQAHARSVAQAVQVYPATEHLVLVAHSGAGMLLPAVRQALSRPASGYVFVDAGLPQDGRNRLDLFGDAEAVEAFRHSAVDGLLPCWTDEDLRDAIPDNDLRRRFVAELRSLPLAVYEEPIPVFAGWPDAPCAYLWFTGSPSYQSAIGVARKAKWAVAELPGQHFHMLVDPLAVTEVLLDLVAQRL